MEIEKNKVDLVAFLSTPPKPVINDIPTLIDLIINEYRDLFEWYWYLFVDKTWHYKPKMTKYLDEVPENNSKYFQRYMERFPNATMILLIPLVKVLVLEGNVLNRYDGDFDVELPTIQDIRVGEVMERYKTKKGKQKWR